MRLLLDQDVYAVTARYLRDMGHDVVEVAQIGLAQAKDEEILRAAQAQNRIVVTRDRDYGNLVFVKALGAGVLYLRALPSTLDAVHAQLSRVLHIHAEDDLARAFVVIEPAGYRIRRPAAR